MTTPLIQIIDPSHPDHLCVIARTRITDNRMEYRSGGIWERLNDDQYRVVGEDDNGNIQFGQIIARPRCTFSAADDLDF